MYNRRNRAPPLQHNGTYPWSAGVEYSGTPGVRITTPKVTRAPGGHRSAGTPSRLDRTVVTLVDFHGSPVRVLDDDPATPWHLLMPTQERCLEASQIGGGRIQGINVETGERGATLTDCGRPTRGLRRVDRDMYAANLGSEVHRAFSVVLILQSDAGRSVKFRGLLGLRCKQHQGSDLDHAHNPATIDSAHLSPLRRSPMRQVARWRRTVPPYIAAAGRAAASGFTIWTMLNSSSISVVLQTYRPERDAFVELLAGLSADDWAADRMSGLQRPFGFRAPGSLPRDAECTLVSATVPPGGCRPGDRGDGVILPTFAPSG